MLTITAVIRARKGFEQAMHDQLVAVAEHARREEPGTVDYFVARDVADPAVFTTYERYVDEAAMNRHNGSVAVGRFFEAAKPMLEGTVTVITANEVFSKRA